MKIIITILFSFLFLQSFSQDSIQIEINYQEGIRGYQLQYSKDTSVVESSQDFSLPTTDGIYQQPVNIYAGFYRIHVLGVNQYTEWKIVASTLPVEVTNVTVKNGVITWTSHNEDLKYYSIEESVDGINFVETGRVQPKGDSEYKFILK